MSRIRIRPFIIASLIAFGGTAPVLAGSGNWTSTGPYGGNVLRLLSWKFSPTTLWATGQGGIFRSSSGGSSWARISTGLPDGVYPFALAASTTSSPVLYLGAGNGTYRSGDGGDLWVQVSSPSADYATTDLAVRPGTTNNVVASFFTAVRVSSNGGSSWGPTFSPSADFNTYSVEYATDGTLYVGGDDSRGLHVFKSIDGGANWLPTVSVPALARITRLLAAPTNSSRLYAISSSELATSANGGISWITVALPSSCTLSGLGSGSSAIAVSPSSDTTVLLGCREGLIKTGNATVASPVWTSVSTASGLTANGSDGVTITAFALHANYPATPGIWVGSQDAGLFASSNDGASWSTINQNYASLNIRALATHPRDTTASVVLAGQGDANSPDRPLWKSPDGGATWAASASGLNAEQLRALAIDATTTDTNTLTAEAFTVLGVGRSENFTTPRDGGIYKSSDAGASWTTIDNGIPFDTAPIPRRNMGTVRAVAMDSRSCARPPASGPCPPGSDPLQTAYVGGSGRLNVGSTAYLAARIYKTSTAGSLWTASDTGLPLPQDLGPVGAGNSASTGGVVQLAVDPQNTAIVYATTFLNWPGYNNFGGLVPTLANGVFKSTNGGASWSHSSTGIPRIRGAGSSVQDVLAFALNPADPQMLYAGVSNLFPLVIGSGNSGSVYKSINGGASWTQVGTGIAGQDVRALLIDPADPSGNTVYAGTGGGSANPGGVYRTSDGGVTWNSFSLGLPSYSSTSLALPPRSVGAAPRILAGTPAGVWDYSFVADEDSDGAPSVIENGVIAGDGNGDGIQDATQSGVASVSGPASLAPGETNAPNGTSVAITTSIVGGSCTRLNDTSNLQADLYPPDPLGTASAHEPWGLMHIALPACASTTLRVKFHGASFDGNWTWRNYGPRVPGDDSSFGWYSFAGARRVDAQTWELDIAANRQGNYRNDANNILFIGGPALLPDLIYGNGLE